MKHDPTPARAHRRPKDNDNVTIGQGDGVNAEDGGADPNTWGAVHLREEGATGLQPTTLSALRLPRLDLIGI